MKRNFTTATRVFCLFRHIFDLNVIYRLEVKWDFDKHKYMNLKYAKQELFVCLANVFIF